MVRQVGQMVLVDMEVDLVVQVVSVDLEVTMVRQVDQVVLVYMAEDLGVMVVQVDLVNIIVGLVVQVVQVVQVVLEEDLVEVLVVEDLLVGDINQEVDLTKQEVEFFLIFEHYGYKVEKYEFLLK